MWHKKMEHSDISVLYIDLFEKMVTTVFWGFQLKLPYYKSSESVISETTHVLP